MKNFWQKLSPRFAKATEGKPFFCLAPMYDVTDAAFRQMFVKYSKGECAKSDLATRSTTSHKEFRSPTSRSPEVGLRNSKSLVLFTEFVSADGLASEAGRPKLLRELYFTEAERPIVAQIFGANPATIREAVKIIAKLGFDGVDINMGCPDRAVNKIGAGAALYKTPELAKEIILAAKEVAGAMPVSVKMRIGWGRPDKKDFIKWFKTIVSAEPAAITIHFRTRNEMSEPKAHWEFATIARQLAKGTDIVLIGNGDVKDMKEGEKLAKKYDLDGIMIGRGAFGRPWIFAGEEVRSRTSRSQVRLRTSEPEDKLKILLEHSQLFWDLYGPTKTNQKLFNGHRKNFAVMRKHFKAYVSGFPGATALRAQLMQTNNPDEVKEVIDKFLQS